MREINFDITNVETTTDGNKIYIVVDWVGDESKVDNLFIDLLDSEHELIDDCIYPKPRHTFYVHDYQLDLLCEQKNEFAFYVAMYDRVINEADGSYSKNELLASKGPFKVSLENALSNV